MKKFLQENWFKVGVLSILILFLLLGIYILIFKKDISNNQISNNNLIDELVIATSSDLSIPEPSAVENKLDSKDNPKANSSKVLSKTNTQESVAPVKTVTQATVVTKTSEPVISYNHDSFVTELSGIYKKVIADFSNSVNQNIMTLIHKRDSGQAQGYINSGYDIISAEKDKIKNLESRYKNLNYEDSKALYAMKKAIDYYYLALVVEKKVYNRNGNDWGFQTYDVSSIVEHNSMASSYLDDVYEYLLLQ